MSLAKVRQAAEAICHGLWETDFRHLGDSANHVDTWFTRGRHEKICRVTVTRSRFAVADYVFVSFEFPNVATGRVIPVNIRMQVDCSGTQAQVQEATETTLQRCLELWRDVLQQTGPASREAGLTRQARIQEIAAQDDAQAAQEAGEPPAASPPPPGS